MLAPYSFIPYSAPDSSIRFGAGKGLHGCTVLHLSHTRTLFLTPAIFHPYAFPPSSPWAPWIAFAAFNLFRKVV